MADASGGRPDADALVLGADVEGLAAAATLARAGRRVIVLDPGSSPGGAWAGDEPHPGHPAQGLLHDASGTRRELLAPLQLERFGLAWRDDAPALAVGTAEGGEPRVLRLAGGAGGEGASDPGTVAGDEDWRAFVLRVRRFVLGLLDAAPPVLARPRMAELWSLAARAVELRRLGRADMLELLRLGPMSAADLAADRFRDEALRVAVVVPALAGSYVGPRAPGTALLVLLRECAAGPEPRGGGAALARALAACASAHGAELRLGSAPRRLVLEDGRVGGVELADGSRLAAGLVLSALGPRATFEGLVPRRALAPSLADTARSWRSRGTLAVLRLALSERPRLAGGAPAPERLLTARRLDDLERACDAPKYRALAERPVLDASLAGEGGASLLSALVHGAPHDLAGGWDAAARERLAERALAELETLLPGLSASVRARELLAPPDLEARTGLAGGHLLGGEPALDQLGPLRPSLALGRYATPLPGLFLCGPSSHPGGAFPGGAGVLGARAALGA